MLVFFCLLFSYNTRPNFAQEQPNTQQQVQSNTKTKPSFLFSLRAKLMEFHIKVMTTFNTHSADLVFISDPFYAIHYIGESISGYSKFYSLANQYGVEARMFVLLESSLDEEEGIKIATLPNYFPYFTVLDSLYIRQAKRVVVSPLLHVLAPLQYQTILKIRSHINVPVQTIAYDANLYNHNYLTVDYSEAMWELGKVAAQYAYQNNQDDPQIHLILDLNQIDQIESRLQYFLKSAYQEHPQISITHYWNPRNPGDEPHTRKRIDQIPNDAIIVLDAGMHTIIAVSDFVTQHSNTPALWENRFFIVSDISSEQLRYKVPIVAAVEIPNDFVFKNNHNTKAILRRLK